MRNRCQEIGTKKLAYPIQLKKNGFYTLIEFKGEGTVVADLETAFKRDERVIRYLTTKLDKHAVDYAVTRRSKLKLRKLNSLTLNKFKTMAIDDMAKQASAGANRK